MIAEHADHIYFNNPENWRTYVKPEPAIGTPATPAVGAGNAAPAAGTPPPKA